MQRRAHRSAIYSAGRLVTTASSSHSILTGRRSFHVHKVAVLSCCGLGYFFGLGCSIERHFQTTRERRNLATRATDLFALPQNFFEQALDLVSNRPSRRIEDR
jgi:hypothetical protein